MFVHVNGVDIYYTVQGQGRPLLMIHGNGEDHSIFTEAVAVLKDYFTCYVVDSRGHGSSTEVEEYHYQDMADDMLALIRELDLKDVAVYGFSDGGIIGLLMASQSNLVKNLVVSGANIDPKGVKSLVYLGMRLGYLKTGEPKLKLMLDEPHISLEELQKIQTKTLVVAGEHDLIRYRHTKQIAEAIPGCRLRILRGEDHGSYIVHSDKIAHLIVRWMK